MGNTNLEFLTILEAIIVDRLKNPTQDSYTASLAALGPKRVAQKVGEEAVEVALAAVAGEREEVISESADLIYHLLILLHTRTIQLSDVMAELESRHTG